MVFSSLEFVFIFLPICFCGYFLVPKTKIRYKNIFLLIMSLGFYAFGEPRFVLIMLLSICVNHIFGLGAGRLRELGLNTKALLCGMAVFNLGILFIYKYLNFTIFQIDRFFRADIPGTSFVLPIGISFFTFQAMSYVIDVARGSALAQKNPLNTALYISLFPQLIAGPIIRYKTISEQLLSRSVSMDDFIEGIKRFIIGFSKKIIIANTVAVCADQAFSLLEDGSFSIPVLMAWLGALCYTLQIYFDFSGYSDMAIGLGRMFGFSITENFNYPYAAKTITEFWRRWHISLSSWFRDYVYIPLGGSRVDRKSRLVFNLFVTWMLTGAWHGANWTFFLWGFFYFVLLAFEKLTGIPKKIEGRFAASILYRAFTIICFVCGWVLFRANDLGQAAAYFKTMAGQGFPGGEAVWADAEAIYMFSDNIVVIILAVFLATPAFKIFFKKVFNQRWALAENTLYLALFFVALAFMVSSRYNPFIYFNF